MNMKSLETLMQYIGPRIHHNENHAYPINSKQRLALTLRYLKHQNVHNLK